MDPDRRYPSDVFRPGSLCEHCKGLIEETLEEFRVKSQGDSMVLQEGLPRETPEECSLCQGLFAEVESFVQLLLAAVSEHEYGSFLVGLVLDGELLSREEELLRELSEKTGTEFPARFEKELKTVIGRLMEERTGRKVDFHRPDIMMILDTRYDDVRLQVSSIYVYGRYRKLERGIPQTIWHCKKCYGRGCRYCDFTGKFYETSVQELIGEPFLEATGGTKASFHGMGREDIDARMLGNGRPFVLEVKEPKKRFLDYRQLEKESNARLAGRVEICELRPSSHQEVVQIKASDHAKRYRIQVTTGQPVDTEKLGLALRTLRGATIQQETPRRVKHRRANKVRERRVFEVEGKVMGERGLELEVKGESGLYIKELVHGDEGRTQPNLSDLLENQCSVDTLDVVWIYDSDEGEDTGANAEGRE